MDSRHRIRKIEYLVNSDDLTVWFEDSEEPFSPQEFRQRTPTRVGLDAIKMSLVVLSETFNEVMSSRHS